jgi:rhodanese-related sulfurtransferase
MQTVVNGVRRRAVVVCDTGRRSADASRVGSSMTKERIAF